MGEEGCEQVTKRTCMQRRTNGNEKSVATNRILHEERLWDIRSEHIEQKGMAWINDFFFRYAPPFS